MKKLIAGLMAVMFVSVSGPALAQEKKEEQKKSAKKADKTTNADGEKKAKTKKGGC
jgi:hypothetical protein